MRVCECGKPSLPAYKGKGSRCDECQRAIAKTFSDKYKTEERKYTNPSYSDASIDTHKLLQRAWT